MYEGIGNGIINAFIFITIVCAVVPIGGYLLIDWLFIDDAIRVEERIEPKIELFINDDGVVDTIFIYSEP